MYNSKWCIISYVITETPYWQINIIPPNAKIYDGFEFGLPLGYKFNTDKEAIEFAKKIDEFMSQTKEDNMFHVGPCKVIKHYMSIEYQCPVNNSKHSVKIPNPVITETEDDIDSYKLIDIQCVCGKTHTYELSRTSDL